MLCVCVRSRACARVSTWQNDGSAVFTVSSLPGPGGSRAVACGDLNSDGHIDIILAHGNHADQVLLNSGSGTFPSVSVDLPGPSTTTRRSSRAIALGDLDGDGDLDVLVGAEGENQIIFNGGDGLVWTSLQLPRGTGDGHSISNTMAVAIADLNGDGSLDAILGNAGRSSLILINDGSDQFIISDLIAGALTIEGGGALAIADVNNDGALECVHGVPTRAPYLSPPASLAHCLCRPLERRAFESHARSILSGSSGSPAQLLMSMRCADTGTARSSSAYGCVRCPAPASFREAANREVCIECDAHSQLDARGGCSACSPGFSRYHGAAQCTPCAPGRAQLFGAGTSCVPCPPGKYSPFAGSVLCFDCPLGAFAAGHGRQGCDTCLAGTFAAAPGQLSCALCATGGYCPDAGAASASVYRQCTAGTYNPTEGASSNASCISCPVGKANPVPGSTSEAACTNCLPGSHAGTNGTDICRLCAPGTFQGTHGQTACQDCTPGYLCVLGSSAPQPCPGGTHANQTVLNLAGFLSSLDQCVVCPPGTLCPVGSAAPEPCAPGTYNDQPQRQTCRKCVPGSFQELEGQTACISCTPGFYCVEGAAAALPCPGGTHKNLTLTVMTSVDDCVICPVGTFCSVGSETPTDCAPGTYNDQLNASRCVDCHAGAFQNVAGSTACNDCTAGDYCGRGAAAALPCLAGSYSNSASLDEASDCTPCPAGSSCSTGSTAHTPCLPGSFSATMGQPICTLCAAGTFTGTSNNTACETCTPGYLCVEGSSAPQPCPGGTHADQGVLATVGFLGNLATDCIICLAGTSCSVGSATPTTCLPGSIAPTANQETCTLCEAGKYQRVYGQTACIDCVPGFFCRRGAATPEPCPAGTSANVTGMYSSGQCTPVPIDFWAPLGSSVPEPCPTSGFFCPGALRDELHGGAKPVLMPVGQSTRQEETQALTKAMSLDMSIDDFAAHREALKIRLAAQYGVDPSLITLEAVAARRRARALQSGGLQLTITIATSDGSGNTVDLATLQQSVAAVDDAALTTTISIVAVAAGLPPVTVVSQPPVMSTVRVTVPFSCPMGKWCTAGLVVDCPVGTYNPLEDQDFATACVMCPLNSYTLETNSTSRAACVCDEGFYDANASFAVDQALVDAMTAAGNDPVSMMADAVDCQVCPVGTNCGQGSTLEALPLIRGFFRVGDNNTDVRKCPDADANCSTTFGTEECVSTSGCMGGTNSSDLCAPGLTGTFCGTCLQLQDVDPGVDRFYYVKAGEGKPAQCTACGNHVAQTIGVAFAALVALLIAAAGLRRAKRMPIAQEFTAKFTPVAKSKILVGFYAIATKVDKVYMVSLPAEVREVRDRLASVFTFGIEGIATTSLACVGLGGYVAELIFWIIFPATAGLVLYGSIALWLKLRGARTAYSGAQVLPGRRRTSMEAKTNPGGSTPRTDLTDLTQAEEVRGLILEKALPPVLQLMFLLYPLVTNVAFEGFSCYWFKPDAAGFRRGWLVADVRSSPSNLTHVMMHTQRESALHSISHCTGKHRMQHG